MMLAATAVPQTSRLAGRRPLSRTLRQPSGGRCRHATASHCTGRPSSHHHRAAPRRAARKHRAHDPAYVNTVNHNSEHRDKLLQAMRRRLLSSTCPNERRTADASPASSSRATTERRAAAGRCGDVTLLRHRWTGKVSGGTGGQPCEGRRSPPYGRLITGLRAFHQMLDGTIPH